MFDKYQLAKEIGNFFGSFYEQNGKFCINNYSEIYRYDSVDALLTDWVDTLVAHQHDNKDLSGYWEAEIEFIYKEVIGKYPLGIRAGESKTMGKAWLVSIDVTTPNHAHGKNLHLGTYDSIVDAIYARKEFEAILAKRPKVKSLDFLMRTAKQMQAQAKAARNSADDVTKNLISSMVQYGLENLWNDSDIIDTLVDCGIRYDDFQKAGYGNFAREYFSEYKSIDPPEDNISVNDTSVLTADKIENDPYLFTCCADKEYSFLVRAVDVSDAEKAGAAWYAEAIFEPGHFSCWKTDVKDLLMLDRSEILETQAYLQASKQKRVSKSSLAHQIRNAQNKAKGQPQSGLHEQEADR